MEESQVSCRLKGTGGSLTGDPSVWIRSPVRVFLTGNEDFCLVLAEKN